MTGTRTAPHRQPENDAAATWTDRHGHRHLERQPTAHVDEPRMVRVTGPLERAWQHGGDRVELARAALARPNPIVEPDPDNASAALWSWVVQDADAQAVLLWMNAVFDHADVGRAEFTRLEGSDLWSICLRLPAALRTSYRIAVWRTADTPPWRMAVGRRATLLAASHASVADTRCADTVHDSRGVCSSVAAGPEAPPEPWRHAVGGLPVRGSRGAHDATPPRSASAGAAWGSERASQPASRVDELPLAHGDRAWVYSPAAPAGDATPLLVLFDGQAWHSMGVTRVFDEAIAAGILPSLHVAMLRSHSPAERWEQVGVPGAQVDIVLDALLPAVRAGWNVDPRGEATIVSGQSLGGLSALWTLALGEGQVAHAIAQSPSLWRFELHEPLAAATTWSTIDLQAGTFEAEMLADAAVLATGLRGDPRLGSRTVRLTPAEGGHDWAVWRTGLLDALRRFG